MSRCDHCRLHGHLRVTADGCWLWIGSRYTHKGKPTYGQFMAGGTRSTAHRWSYIIHVGPVPAGLDVMHSCDNPPCVNPAHLGPGTRSQNLLDGFAAHPGVCAGENNGRARLTWDDVHAIRNAPRVHGSTLALAARYGVSPTQVTNIKHGRKWPESACPVHSAVEVAA